MANSKPFLCVHGHFYQPPRNDPFTDEYLVEPSADPYKNWNARIAAECYAPNAFAGNFERISFNMGGTLARWMDLEAHATYLRIVNATQAYYRRYGVANGVAQSVHHTILPLARGRDKRCQISWGIASFEYRFGGTPQGIWLPEMAVDYATLEAVVELGLEFVILSGGQVTGELLQGAGPYRVMLPSGRFVSVFVRNNELSNGFSFNMPAAEQARAQVNGALRGAKPGSLTLLATDGETFGHHHAQGVDVLRALTMPTEHDAYEITTLGRYLREHPATVEVEIVENTAWSCSHNLGRWATGCACTSGRNYWKGALRRALDNLSHDIDALYVDVARAYELAPWALRDDYIQVLLGQVEGLGFLANHGLGSLATVKQHRLLQLLEAQIYRQRMFTSCAFFFEDLERVEPRYAIANAVRAIALVRYATATDLTGSFRRDLSIAVSEKTGRTGAQIKDEILAQANLGRSPLGNMMERNGYHVK
ncbi:MAG: DUF3536 domain-containing protein [Chloroflexota bacterium]|nr:DUF3536 domain-containing protein [Chloroflexota bacterium]